MGVDLYHKDGRNHRQRGGQTNRNDEADSLFFRNFENASENSCGWCVPQSCSRNEKSIKRSHFTRTYWMLIMVLFLQNSMLRASNYICVKMVNFIPMHITKAYWGRGGIAVLFLKLDPRWNCVISLKPQSP